MYVAYAGCFAVSCLSIAIVLAYGQEFGKDKALKWLTALFASFIEDVFLLYPLLVRWHTPCLSLRQHLCFAPFFVCFLACLLFGLLDCWRASLRVRLIIIVYERVSRIAGFGGEYLVSAS